jgi:jumonji domain-containing protein 7
MGDSRAVSSMHKDFYENLYCVIRGQKIFTLLPPSDLSFLEYKDCKAATYKYHTDRDDFTIELDDPAETIPWFDVDPDSPNVEQNPRLKNLNALQVTVNEGEVWHWYPRFEQFLIN